MRCDLINRVKVPVLCLHSADDTLSVQRNIDENMYWFRYGVRARVCARMNGREYCIGVCHGRISVSHSALSVRDVCVHSDGHMGVERSIRLHGGPSSLFADLRRLAYATAYPDTSSFPGP